MLCYVNGVSDMERFLFSSLIRVYVILCFGILKHKFYLYCVLPNLTVTYIISYLQIHETFFIQIRILPKTHKLVFSLTNSHYSIDLTPAITILKFLVTGPDDTILVYLFSAGT